MDAIEPWVDPLAMKRLAEALMSPSVARPSTSTEAGYGDEFEGFAKPSSATPLVAPPHPTPPSAPTPAAATPTPMPAVAPPKNASKLVQYCQWIRSRDPVLGVFVLNHDGAVLFEDANHSRFHFMARSLAQAARRNQNAQGHVQMKVGAAGLMEVICVDTTIGAVVVGLIMKQALNAQDVTAIRQSLQQVFATPLS